MNNETAIELLRKYRENTCTEEELAILESWYLKYDLKDLAQLSKEDLVAIEATQAPKPAIEVKEVSLWKKLLVASAVVLILGAGLFFYQNETSFIKHNDSFLSSSEESMPGQRTATLTLSSGEVYNLDLKKKSIVIKENKILYSDGVFISSVRSVEMSITINTPLSGAYQVTLPDGSKVWLNAASSLVFPATFEGSPQRKIAMSGEAYFEIIENKNHPFLVQSKGQEVEVLGTHFNIDSYEDEPNIKTTLLQGILRVRVPNSAASNSSIILKPNEQAILGPSGIKVQHVDAENYKNWTEDLFWFDKEPLESVMRKISRWYDVKVEYQVSDKTKGKLSGDISKNEDIESLLKILEQSMGYKFKLKGKTIVVSE
ncbi:MAG: FecR family protein [Bacteroidota bacterium]